MQIRLVYRHLVDFYGPLQAQEDFDVREDAATVELMAGEWVDVAKEQTPEHRDQDLERR